VTAAAQNPRTPGALCASGLAGKFPRMAGLTLTEVLVATVILVIALVPAMEALQPAVLGSAIHQSRTQLHYHLLAKLQEVLAQPFSALDDEAQAINDHTVASVVYSDVATAPERRLVFLSRYDADNADGNGNFFDGTDAGLIWVRVTIQGTDQAIESLTSAYD
jgi:Tfp pilus assembly protein PilV